MQVETLPSGTLLNGRYRVERALGSGGFGHVYLSVDLHTKTQYAIKEYLVSGASGKAQLEHEAQVLSQLHHPNLPAFLSAFDERGHYYVVLGYIEGNDLTDYVRVVRQKNEVIPLPRLMGWMLSICDAAAFLHSQRPPIIHRDIKPDNIRITPNGTAILVDLGNAKTAADGARTLFFIRHQGTPGYAPLEQYPGGTGTDERSDVYALGGTLYFALTAHEPPSVSARNQSLQQKLSDLPSLQERLAQNPPDVPQEQRQFRLGVSKPSKPAPRHSRHIAQLGTLPPDLLQKLDALIQCAMAMKPKDRYPSVGEFSNDLRMVLNALPDPTKQLVGDGRSIDPHSTQPDLPMLYDAHQNAQAANQGAPFIQAQGPAVSPPQVTPIQGPVAQSPQAQGKAIQLPQPTPAQGLVAQSPQAQGKAVQPPQPTHAQGPTAQSPQAQGQAIQPPLPTPAQNIVRAPLRCTHCGKDLSRPALYCPRCGSPMNTPPQQPNSPRSQASPGPNYPGQGPSQGSPAHDVSEDATILISPPVMPQDSADRTLLMNPSSAQAVPRSGKATTAHAVVSRPQVPTTSSQPVPTVKPSLAPPKSPLSNGYNGVKPFIQSVSAPKQIQEAPASSAPPLAIQADQNSRQKLFITLAIIVVTLIIVFLLLLVFIRGNVDIRHSTH